MPPRDTAGVDYEGRVQHANRRWHLGGTRARGGDLGSVPRRRRPGGRAERAYARGARRAVSHVPLRVLRLRMARSVRLWLLWVPMAALVDRAAGVSVPGTVLPRPAVLGRRPVERRGAPLARRMAPPRARVQGAGRHGVSLRRGRGAGTAP